jgi:ATP-dependent protease HslVU (ClpYQ) peptidase subunit
MSTIVVVKKNGRVCIAADTLVSWGSTKQNSEYLTDKSKIIRVGESYLGITGSSTHRHVIESYFARSENYSLNSVQEIFETWREFHKALKTDYFLNTGDDKEAPYESSHMHVLIANPHGIFGVYGLRSVDEFNKYWAFGSGTDYALGALHCSYDRFDSVEDIARAAVEAAAQFDNSTGLPMTLHAVDLVGE